MKWPFTIRRREEKIERLQSAFPAVEKFGETLTPNMRALRLAMTIGDLMLSMGVPAGRVVSRSLDITEAYCKRPVHIDVSADTIMLSQLRGIDKEPLTLIRPVVPRDINNMTLQLVQKLVYDIDKGKYSLYDAETELDKILKAPIVYPGWLVTTGNASIAGGVSMMFSANWRVWLLTFVIAVLVDRLIALLAKRGLTPFFRQICAAAFVTIAAAVINQFTVSGVGFFAGMHPTLIVVGGIVMLVAGLMIVGAFQDAIEEYYVTANARILKVVMLTMGIVIGILVGLYVAGKLGIGIYVSPDPLSLSAPAYQIIGSAVAAAGFAVGTQTRLRAVAWAAIIGAAALIVMFAARHLGVSVVPASGVAAVVVGVVATVFSRRWRTPSTGIIGAGILPLVPGLMFFNALMQLANYPPGDPSFVRGASTLFMAIATALAIAIGASIGSMLGRPLHHQITRRRNTQPFAIFMREQFKPRHRLGRLTLMHSFGHFWHPDNEDKPQL